MSRSTPTIKSKFSLLAACCSALGVKNDIDSLHDVTNNNNDVDAEDYDVAKRQALRDGVFKARDDNGVADKTIVNNNNDELKELSTVVHFDSSCCSPTTPLSGHGMIFDGRSDVNDVSWFVRSPRAILHDSSRQSTGYLCSTASRGDVIINHNAVQIHDACNVSDKRSIRHCHDVAGDSLSAWSNVTYQRDAKETATPPSGGSSYQEHNGQLQQQQHHTAGHRKKTVPGMYCTEQESIGYNIGRYDSSVVGSMGSCTTEMISESSNSGNTALQPEPVRISQNRYVPPSCETQIVKNPDQRLTVHEDISSCVTTTDLSSNVTSDVSIYTEYVTFDMTHICPPFRLGLSVLGGRTRDGRHDAGIYVSAVRAGSASERTGRIYPGDVILEVNGVDLESMRNEEALTVLKEEIALGEESGMVTLLVGRYYVDSLNVVLQAAAAGDDLGLFTIEANQGHAVPPLSAYAHNRSRNQDGVLPRVPCGSVMFLGTELIDWVQKNVQGLEARTDALGYVRNLLKNGHVSAVDAQGYLVDERTWEQFSQFDWFTFTDSSHVLHSSVAVGQRQRADKLTKCVNELDILAMC